MLNIELTKEIHQKISLAEEMEEAFKNPNAVRAVIGDNPALVNKIRNYLKNR